MKRKAHTMLRHFLHTNKPFLRRTAATLLACLSVMFTTATASLAEMRALLEAGEYALAAQVEGPRLLQTLQAEPEAHYLYSYALYLVGEFAEADRQLEQARALSAQLQGHHLHLQGLLYAAQGDLLAAKRALAESFGLEPRYQVARDWGRVAWQHGDFDTALQAYQAAEQQAAGRYDPWLHLNQARLLLHQHNYHDAIARLEVTLDMLDQVDESSLLPSPAYTEAFYLLGQAYEALGETEQATAHYQAAQSVDPEFPAAQRALERLRAAREANGEP